MTKVLLKAIELVTGDQWEAAHQIVQLYDIDPTAAWIHAVLHKIGGDHNNSHYWYRWAGKMEWVDQEPLAELRAIKAAIEG